MSRDPRRVPAPRARRRAARAARVHADRRRPVHRPRPGAGRHRRRDRRGPAPADSDAPGLSRLAAIRRDLVPSLALRRVTRGGSSGAILIVLMATATIGAFSGATLVHLDRAAGGRRLGGDRRAVPHRRVPDPAAELASTRCAARCRGGRRASTRSRRSCRTRFLPLEFIAIDAADIRGGGRRCPAGRPPAAGDADAGQPTSRCRRSSPTT